ncbi:ATP-binding cassette domain-containing protein [Eggerthellaceae bacterium zg-887]|uniref:ABC transporter ATP-binding protein n=1 Tax=Xiamenia xianingshaonis TaxID=2682776 RepID=UPI0013ED3CFE|nr:ABC transporter ATP-binding protein [Xiamenia xianingshaonis]NGM17456.1 ATP-binding cassette domain-containing protein [Eggerthellaceae bacterium zg-893]NHM16802.1 ATP-binding cassette domain-containing protein [Xiamenia xianingshaonis]
MAFLEVTDVRKGYGEGDAHIEVIKGVSTSLEKGDFASLLGPSGSGKSTFLNIVGGLEPCDGGRVVVDGVDITGLSDREVGEYRRAELGFVFQFYNLIPDLTVRENIEVCAHLSEDPLPLDDLLRSLGLWDQRRKFPRQMSGGQQQRCAIGRALVKNPKLLLCDEPTGALDYQTSLEILALMEEVNREYGCTVVVVTHNDAIARMSNRIMRLHDGMLVEDSVNEERVPALSLEW